MPYEIQPGPHANIVCLSYSGKISKEDMHIDDLLGLSKPMYILMDASNMSVKLPKGFLNNAASSFFINENLRHMALYTGSNTLDLLAQTIANLTQRRDKLSIHKSREEALNYLLNQIDTIGV